MPGRSLQILLGLMATAVALSGWIFGWQWKRAAADFQKQLEGTAFTREEQILIDLQDQLDAERSENERLTAELRKISEPEPEE